MPLFQNESSCKTFEFDLHENEPLDGTHFHMNGFAQNRFETEVKTNSEMASST